MAQRLPVNAVVDVYRGFNASQPYPSVAALPAARGVRGHLRQHVRSGRFGNGLALHWTTLLDVPLGTDLRSAYSTQLNSWQPAHADTVLLKDYPSPGWCTAFLVVFVERVQRKQGGDCLRAYLDRLRPRSGACFQGPCPEPLPATLHATVPTGGGCPCLDEVVVALLHDADTGTWAGSTLVCGGQNFSVVLQPGLASCADATLTVDFENHGVVGPVSIEPGCSCTPLHLGFANLLFPELGGECGGPISVVVTI